jgi:hypothetical protein
MPLYRAATGAAVSSSPGDFFLIAELIRQRSATAQMKRLHPRKRVLTCALALTIFGHSSFLTGTELLSVLMRSESPRWDLTPAPVTAIILSAIPRADVIRGYWFIYPHGSEAGYRVLIQTNSRQWLELWSSGRVIRFVIEGRALVKSTNGSTLLRLGDTPNLQFEAFIPDVNSSNQLALFRLRLNGAPGQWQTFSVLNLIL